MTVGVRIKGSPPTFTGGPCPYYSFDHRGWLPCAIAWDPETGRFTRLEAFTTWREAEEASRFLARSTAC